MATSDLIKGMIKPIILKLLEENGKMYGYEITQKVEEQTQGYIKLTFGALYPILHKMESEEILETETELVNNRVRVYYKLTENGKKSAEIKIAELKDFVNILNTMLASKTEISQCIP